MIVRFFAFYCFEVFLFFFYCVYLIFPTSSREEVSGEARRTLRSLPSKSAEKEKFKPMPSFSEMVSYIQEKVRPSIIKKKKNPKNNG